MSTGLANCRDELISCRQLLTMGEVGLFTIMQLPTPMDSLCRWLPARADDNTGGSIIIDNYFYALKTQCAMRNAMSRNEHNKDDAETLSKNHFLA